MNPRKHSALAAAVASVAIAGTALARLPDGVVRLRGTANTLEAVLNYAPSTHSINGFAIHYTCHGKPAATDSDVYEIVDGGDDSKPLARAGNDGRLTATLKGHISRYTEDGQRPIGAGRLVLDANVSTSKSKRAIRGTARVRSSKCPSSTLRLSVTGPR
jgi:hypothetical protein